MEAFRTHTGIGVPLRRSNVDTDQIIPAVYLKRVTRTGFEDGFSPLARDPSFILNLSPSTRVRFWWQARISAPVHPGARRLGADGLRIPGGDLVPIRRYFPRQRGQGGLLAARSPRTMSNCCGS
jgi:hypothetical protein